MQNKTQDLSGLQTPLFLPEKLRQRGKATYPGHTARRVLLLGPPDMPNLTQLPHPGNSRRSISVYGMCEARGDAGTKKMRLGTAGRPGQWVTPQAGLSHCPQLQGPGRELWGRACRRPLPENPPSGQSVAPALPAAFIWGSQGPH